MRNSQSKLKVWMNLLGFEKIIVGVMSTVLAIMLGYWLNGVFKPWIIVFSLIFIIAAMIFSNLSYALALVKQEPISRTYLFAKGINLKKLTIKQIKTSFIISTFVVIVLFLLLLLISDVQLGSFLILFGFFLYFLFSSIIFSRARKNDFDILRLRELSTFLYLGIFGVMGNIYLYSGEFNYLSLYPAVGFGFFAITIYNLDNIRASRLDVQYNDITLATILSPGDCRHFHAFTIMMGFIFYISFTSYSMKLVESYVYLIVSPFFIYHLYQIYKKSSLQNYYKQTEFAKTLVATVNFCFMICVLYVSIYY